MPSAAGQSSKHHNSGIGSAAAIARWCARHIHRQEMPSRLEWRRHHCPSGTHSRVPDDRDFCLASPRRQRSTWPDRATVFSDIIERFEVGALCFGRLSKAHHNRLKVGCCRSGASFGSTGRRALACLPCGECQLQKVKRTRALKGRPSLSEQSRNVCFLGEADIARFRALSCILEWQNRRNRAERSTSGRVKSGHAED